MNNNSVKVSRLKFSLVLAAFITPLLIALGGYYFFPSLFTSSSTVNHAPLIQPIVTLEPFTNLKLDGSEVTLKTLRRKWTVVHRLDQQCSEACATSLYNTRQSRQALGRDTDRVQRILIGSNINYMEAAGAEQPGMALVLRVLGGLDSQLRPIVEQHGMGPDDALLIDPLGNVMMAIPADLNPSDLLKDLKKLLRLSKIG